MVIVRSISTFSRIVYLAAIIQLRGGARYGDEEAAQLAGAYATLGGMEFIVRRRAGV
jgi:hypothetical protein